MDRVALADRVAPATQSRRAGRLAVRRFASFSFEGEGGAGRDG